VYRTQGGLTRVKLPVRALATPTGFEDVTEKIFP